VRKDLRRALRRAPSILSAIFLVGFAQVADGEVLEYLGRYDCQDGPDHLMDVLALEDDRAIVASNQALALVDLAALPPQGTQTYLSRLQGLNARDVVGRDERWFYANLNRTGNGGSAGVAVVERLDDELVLRTTLEETDVLYEKPFVTASHLYVPAHGGGLRVFELTDPAMPTLVGSLTQGLDDAWAVAVAGARAYVADGAGGLKVVDVTDPTRPVLIGGESMAQALGTAEAVTVHQGNVYVAAGSAGVAFYRGGDPAARANFPVAGSAEDLDVTGNRLVVSDFAGLAVFDIAPDGSLLRLCGETAHRRLAGSRVRLRLCEGVDATNDGRVLCGNWNYMDVYRLRAAGAAEQPDIDASTQRLRFAAGGGTAEVQVSNDGDASLSITGISCGSPAFSFDPAGSVLEPGESMTLDLAYTPSGVRDEGILEIASNDPDEAILPIQLFGRTQYLDPGETATPFALPLWRKDQGGTWLESDFELAAHAGKIVWFQVYGLW